MIKFQNKNHFERDILIMFLRNIIPSCLLNKVHLQPDEPIIALMRSAAIETSFPATVSEPYRVISEPLLLSYK